ncbi:hypothetical protein P3S68_001391 [Capsicum galapagoense]
MEEFYGASSFRVYTKADTGFSLTVRNGEVVLADYDPADPFQHWYRDARYGEDVRDRDGYPSFTLVNKGAGLALKHADSPRENVQLAEYDPSEVDVSVLWTEGDDRGEGFRAVRMVTDISLNLDAWGAGKETGEGIVDGNNVAVCEWAEGENLNQLWFIEPY